MSILTLGSKKGREGKFSIKEREKENFQSKRKRKRKEGKFPIKEKAKKESPKKSLQRIQDDNQNTRQKNRI